MNKKTNLSKTVRVSFRFIYSALHLNHKCYDKGAHYRYIHLCTDVTRKVIGVVVTCHNFKT